MNRNDKNIISFTIIGHALTHTYELSIPILMTVWLLEFSVTTSTLGVIVAIGYALFGAGALPGGILVDSIGSRVLIIGCLLGMGASFIAIGVAPSLPVLAIAIASWGISASVYHPAGLSLISKGVTNPGKAFGFHGAGGNVGIAFGPLLVALLLLALDWRTVSIVIGVLGILGALYGSRLSFTEGAMVTEPTVQADGGMGGLGALRDDVRQLATIGFLLVIGIVLFDGLFYRGLLTFLPEVLGGFLEPMADILPEISVGRGDAETGVFDGGRYLYVFLLLIGIIGQYAGGVLVNRIPTEHGLAAFLGVMAILALMFVPMASFGIYTLLLVLVLLGFFMFGIQPMTQATVAKYSPADVRGLSYGFAYLAIFGIGALGAAIAGIALDFASVPVLFVTLAIIAGIGCGLSLVLMYRADAP